MAEKRLMPGSIIFHPKFGTGKVTATDDDNFKVTVEFDCDSEDKRKLSVLYVLHHCVILNEVQEMEDDEDFESEEVKDIIRGQDPFDEMDEALRNEAVCEIAADKSNIDEKIARIVEEFRKKYDLKDAECVVLKDFFSFWAHIDSSDEKRFGIKCNLFVRCDDYSEGKQFVEEVLDSSEKLGLLERGSLCCSEDDFLSHKDLFSHEDNRLSDNSMIGIYGCGIPEPGAIARGYGTRSEHEEMEKAAKNSLARKWKEAASNADDNPDCAIIAVGSSDFYDFLRLPQNADLYYRQFPHRIYVPELSEKNIFEEIMEKINQTDLKMTQYFRAELEKYVETVYPIAALRGREFVKDTINRVMVRYFQGTADGKIHKECVPHYRPKKSFDEIMEKINSLIGLKKVKDKFQSLYNDSQDELRTENMKLNYVFEGNPGTGKTTVARMAAEFLQAARLIRNGRNFIEVSRGDFADEYMHSSEKRMQALLRDAKGGVLFIDEAYFLSDDTHQTYREALDVLLAAMGDPQKDFAVILAGYTGKMEHMLDTNPGLRSRLGGTFEFEDLTVDELMTVFKDLAQKEGRKVADDADELLKKRIGLEMTTKDFGNARAMENLYRDLVSKCLEKDPKAKTITAEVIQDSMPDSMKATLEDMVGLQEIKNELGIFEKEVRYRKFLSGEDVETPAPRMHMMFIGNPGTGKTTVAEKIADCLFKIGVMKSNKVTVVERKDLVSPNKGDTALKTSAVIEEAMNGVLFIDEAYSLYRATDPGDFGMEAIETLITAMETYRDRLIVIFAGYEDEMKAFLNANPGIESRIGRTFRFKDYSVPELIEMFRRKVADGGFELDEKTAQNVGEVMDYFSGTERFGNGRFVDSFIDRMVKKRSLREPYDKKILPEDIPTIREMLDILPRGGPTDGEKSSDEWVRVACHEAGHALVGKYLDPFRHVAYITIRARANSEGCTVMENVPIVYTEKFLKAQLAINFGGRNAERSLLGDSSAGCAVDIFNAKRIASDMVNLFAMGDFGVTKEVDLIREADANAAKVIEEHRNELINVTKALLKNGVLSGKQFESVVEKGEMPDEMREGWMDEKPEEQSEEKSQEQPEEKTQEQPEEKTQEQPEDK